MPPSFYHRRHPRPPSYLPLGFHPPPPPSLPLPPPTTLSLRLPSLSDSPVAEGGECGARTALSFAFFLFFLSSFPRAAVIRPPAHPASGRPSVAVRAGCLLSRISFQNPANFQGPFIAFPRDRRPISDPRPALFSPVFIFQPETRYRG